MRDLEALRLWIETALASGVLKHWAGGLANQAHARVSRGRNDYPANLKRRYRLRQPDFDLGFVAGLQIDRLRGCHIERAGIIQLRVCQRFGAPRPVQPGCDADKVMSRRKREDPKGTGL